MGQIEKKRSGCLTALLMFILVISSSVVLLGLFYSINVGIQFGLSAGPVPLLEASSLVSIFNIIFVVAVMRWKKWGVYGLFFGVILITLIELNLIFSGQPPGAAPTGFIYVFLVLLEIIVLFILLRPAWKYME